MNQSLYMLIFATFFNYMYAMQELDKKVLLAALKKHGLAQLDKNINRSGIGVAHITYRFPLISTDALYYEVNAIHIEFGKLTPPNTFNSFRCQMTEKTVYSAPMFMLENSLEDLYTFHTLYNKADLQQLLHE